MTLQYEQLETPIGTLLLVANERGLERIEFPVTSGTHTINPAWSRGGAIVEETARQLSEYFAGERQQFDLPLNASGTTFMKSVWEELTRIPFGETTSYGSIANTLGKPSAARAIGSANGKNPIPIVVPCHRVIGADGSLTGFAGGLDIKRQLLELEGILEVSAR